MLNDHADPTDDDLLARVREGDTNAFASLYLRYRQHATRAAHRIGLRGQDADDVVADAFTRTLRALAHGKGPTDNFPGYLTTAVRRVAWSLSEDRSRCFATEDANLLDESVTDVVPESIVESLVGRALLNLPPQWREVLWRVEVDGEKVSTIAAETGRSPNSVSALASRARRRLRVELAQLATVPSVLLPHAEDYSVEVA